MNSTQINWSDACIGCCKGNNGTTVVRNTLDGQFAVIDAKSSRVIKVFSDSLHARRYNFAIHGEHLGE